MFPGEFFQSLEKRHKLRGIFDMHQLEECIHADEGNIEIHGQHAADESEECLRRALARSGIGACIHKADFMAKVVHVALVIVDKYNDSVFDLERVVGQVKQPLGLSTALDAGDDLYHDNHSFLC